MLVNCGTLTFKIFVICETVKALWCVSLVLVQTLRTFELIFYCVPDFPETYLIFRPTGASIHGHQNCGGQRPGAWETHTSLLVTEAGCKNLHKLLRLAVGCKDVCRHLVTVVGCKNLHELSRTVIGCKDVGRHSETGFNNLHELSRTVIECRDVCRL